MNILARWEDLLRRFAAIHQGFAFRHPRDVYPRIGGVGRVVCAATNKKGPPSSG